MVDCCFGNRAKVIAAKQWPRTARISILQNARRREGQKENTRRREGHRKKLSLSRRFVGDRFRCSRPLRRSMGSGSCVGVCFSFPSGKFVIISLFLFSDASLNNIRFSWQTLENFQLASNTFLKTHFNNDS